MYELMSKPIQFLNQKFQQRVSFFKQCVELVLSVIAITMSNGNRRTLWHMMTSSNGNIFRVTGPLCGGPVNSPHKGQWRWALMFSLICAGINDWVNNRKVGDLRRHRSHYDVNVMIFFNRSYFEVWGSWFPLLAFINQSGMSWYSFNISLYG